MSVPAGEMEIHRRYMQRAAELAQRAHGETSPNPLVGAVIVRDGKVIGEGWHHRAGMPHAEIEALRDAGNDAAGATIYVTLEPCSTCGRTGACTSALIAAGVTKVVVGCTDPNPNHAGRGLAILESAGIEVICGVEEKLCRDLNRAFFKWISTGKPWVILKMAVTLDGRIATAGGESKWITGSAARSRVQYLRRWCDAIMVSAETWKLDDPGLTVREPEKWSRQPLIIIARNRTPEEEIIASYPGRQVHCVNFTGDIRDSWEKFLLAMGRRAVTALLIEGGGELAAMALEADAVDEVEFHIAPKLLGGRNSRNAVGGRDPEHLADAVQLTDITTCRYGDDTAISGIVAGHGI